jgi:hypothetical protein
MSFLCTLGFHYFTKQNTLPPSRQKREMLNFEGLNKLTIKAKAIAQKMAIKIPRIHKYLFVHSWL